LGASVGFALIVNTGTTHGNMRYHIELKDIFAYAGSAVNSRAKLLTIVFAC
jgi:hypothetical protein